MLEHIMARKQQLTSIVDLITNFFSPSPHTVLEPISNFGSLSLTMLKESKYSQYDQDSNEARPPQRRKRLRQSVVGTSNGQKESDGSGQEVVPRHHQHSLVESGSQSEVDHGEEVVEFEVSEDDLVDLFGCPQSSNDSTRLSEEERTKSDSMPQESYAWDAAKSHYKSVNHDILPSHYSISEEGKLGKVPIPALFTAGMLQSDPNQSFGVFKWL